MGTANRFFAKLRAMAFGAAADGELTREVNAHIAMLEDDYRRKGMSGAEAKVAARRRFGAESLAKERHRDERGFLWLSQALQDTRYALRTLRKNPSFTVIALTTLALGIGANTAIFTVVNGVLLRPLPFPDADRIVAISRPTGLASVPMFVYWQQRNPGLEDISAYIESTPVPAKLGEQQEIAGVSRVSNNFFRLFGALPLLGRAFEGNEDKPGAEPVAVLSYAYWQKRFGGKRDVLGQSIDLGGVPTTVVGVLSPGFQSYPPADLWVPLQADPNSRDQAHYLRVSARLSAAMSLSEANAAMRLLGKQFVESHPEQLGGDDDIIVTALQRNVT